MYPQESEDRRQERAHASTESKPRRFDERRARRLARQREERALGIGNRQRLSVGLPLDGADS